MPPLKYKVCVSYHSAFGDACVKAIRRLFEILSCFIHTLTLYCLGGESAIYPIVAICLYTTTQYIVNMFFLFSVLVANARTILDLQTNKPQCQKYPLKLEVRNIRSTNLQRSYNLMRNNSVNNNEIK